MQDGDENSGKPRTQVLEAEDSAPIRGRVLLVDDDAMPRRAYERWLRARGHEIVEVSNGHDAVARAKQQEFEAVVSDVRMPDIDGIELLRLLHEHDPDLPVLLISGDPDIGSAMKAIEYGAIEYLTKPVDLDKLAASVARAIGVRRQRIETKRELEQYRSGERGRGASVAPKSDRPWSGMLLGGRYRVGRLLGEGGMGCVYEAVREDFAQMRVAVKVLRPELGVRPELFARFRREAEVVAAIDHPNIVKILDFEAPEGEPAYIVMERLVGGTLGQRLAAEGPLEPGRVAFIASQALSALGAAHRMDVVHRDLKPENVFLTAMAGLSDIVKLLDFGIAKLLDASGEASLTETGIVLGTPPYMAPEHARGDAVDARSDVYAVGCLMYEALTGKRPFTGKNFNALLFAIQEASPTPIRELLPELDPELEDVVRRAMSKDPDARYGGAAEMAEALAVWIPMAPKSARGSGAPSARSDAPEKT